MSTVAVIGAGMGGLAGALRLARLGHRVTIFEARAHAGGLASNEIHEGFVFDVGPYLLLDFPGLSRAFTWLGLRLDEHVALQRIDDVCEIGGGSAPPIRFHSDLARTAAGLERSYPGSGARYEALVASVTRTYARLQPLLFEPNPRRALPRHPGAWPAVPFLLKPLARVLASTGLPRPVIEAIAIWSHFVGQPVDEAPSPMAFAPMFLHVQGAFYARGGIGTVPAALARAAIAAGVELRLGARVRAIHCESGRVRGVELDSGRGLHRRRGHLESQRHWHSRPHPGGPDPALTPRRRQSEAAIARGLRLPRHAWPRAQHLPSLSSPRLRPLLRHRHAPRR